VDLTGSFCCDFEFSLATLQIFTIPVSYNTQ